MQIYKRMQKYLQIKDISSKEVALNASIPLNDFENFLEGHDSINSKHLELLNQKYPELIAYGFDIDISLCLTEASNN